MGFPWSNTGWWFSHPSEKYESQLGWLVTQGKINNGNQTTSQNISEQKVCFFPWKPIHWGEPTSETDGEIPTSPYQALRASEMPWNHSKFNKCSCHAPLNQNHQDLAKSWTLLAWRQMLDWTMSGLLGMDIIRTCQNDFGWKKSHTSWYNYWATSFNPLYLTGLSWDVCPSTNWCRISQPTPPLAISALLCSAPVRG